MPCSSDDAQSPVTSNSKADEVWRMLMQQPAGGTTSRRPSLEVARGKGKRGAIATSGLQGPGTKAAEANEVVRAILGRTTCPAPSPTPTAAVPKRAAAAAAKCPPCFEVGADFNLPLWHQHINREVLAMEDERGEVRKRALSRLVDLLFPNKAQDPRVALGEYEEVMASCFKALFKRLTDPSEQCRELATRLTSCFFQTLPGLVPYLAYFFPVVMSRVPEGFSYDSDLQVFVRDVQDHEAYKRGKAVPRQDQEGHGHHKVVEPSEEMRLSFCRLLLTLVQALLERDTGAVLHPYFHDTVLFFQAQLHDPYPDLKIEACRALSLLAESPVYELGMKLYAVALVRAALPLLCHRLAKVRGASIRAIRVLVKVPNRDKRKGAGTEAILDLVGFREDNVIPVRAFYQAEVAYNWLAEVAVDANPSVREQVVLMLADWLTNLPDRYDYETRLVPYLLNALTDDIEAIRLVAMEAVATCGRNFEAEHAEDVMDRRQFGVDGDERCNHNKPLPYPFSERPRLGARLYVRGNAKRVLKPLLEELCNWLCKTRLRSARLLRTLVIYCEEHLVSDFHVMLPYLYKALGLAIKERDVDLEQTLLECYELLGRYVLPDTYVPLIEARVKEDPLETPHGLDDQGKAVVLGVLCALTEGSRPKELWKHLPTLVRLYTTEDQAEAGVLWQASAKALVSLLATVKGKNKAATEAHFLSTGRLTTLRETMYRAFRYLVLCQSRGRAYEGQGESGLITVAARGLTLVNDMLVLEGNEDCSADSLALSIRMYGSRLVKEVTNGANSMSHAWSSDRVSHLLLGAILDWDAALLWDHAVELAGFLCDGSPGCEDEGGHDAVLRSCQFLTRLVDKLGHWRAISHDMPGRSEARWEGALLMKVIDFCCNQERGLWASDATGERSAMRLELLVTLTRYGPWWRWEDLDSNHGHALATLVVFHLQDSSAPVTARLQALQVAEDLLHCQLVSGSSGSPPRPRPRLRAGHRPPKDRQVAECLYLPLMQRLVDGDPQVRQTASQVLHAMLFFLSWKEHMDGGAPDLSTGGGEEATFDSFLNQCLDNLLTEPVLEVRQSLEGVIRMVSVVEPSLYLRTLNEYVTTNRQSLSTDQLDLVSDLIDHGHTLKGLLSMNPHPDHANQ